MGDSFTFDEALEKPKDKSFSFEDAIEPDLSVGGKLNATALGAWAGVSQRAAPSVERTAGVLSEYAPAWDPEATFAYMPPDIAMAAAQRDARTNTQRVKDIQKNPLVLDAAENAKFWKEAIPRTEQEKSGLLAKGAEEGGAMLPYVLPGAPYLIGAEAFADHVVNDYKEAKDNGLSDDDAASKAMEKGIISGTIQAAVFKFLPPKLRKAGEKLIVDRFGEGVLSKFLGGRIASMAETGTLMEAAHIPENIISGRPALEGAASAGLGGVLLGAVGPRGESPEKPRPESDPAAREYRKQKMAARAKDFGITDLSFTDGELDPSRPTDVAHSLGGGKVRVSLKNLHERIDRERGQGVSEEEAIDNVLSEESTHELFRNLKADKETGQPSGDDMALGLWNSMSSIERALFRRKLDGANWKKKSRSDLDLGREAQRFAFQRLKGIRPGEHIFGSASEIGVSKVLTFVEDAIRWTRENLGRTEASGKQRAYLDMLKAKAGELRQSTGEAQPTATRPQLYRGTTLDQWNAIQRGEQPQSEYTTGGNTWATTNLESAKGYTRAEGKNAVIIEYKDSAHDKVSKLTDYAGDHRRQGPLRLEDVQRVTDGEGNVIYEAPEKGAPNALESKATQPVRDVREEPVKGEGEVSTKGAGKEDDEGGGQGTVAQAAQVPLEQAPPVAPTKGAQPVQAPTGLATPPPAELTAGGPAATPSISPAFPEVKMRRLDELSSKIGAKDYKLDKAEYDEYIKLSNELEESERSAGTGDQPSEPSAMSRKGSYDSVEDFEKDLRSSPARLSNKHSDEAGMAVRDISDLNRMAIVMRDSQRDYQKINSEVSAIGRELDKNPNLTDAHRDALQERQMDLMNLFGEISKRGQLAREVIETATNTGSHVEEEATVKADKLGVRPMDWKTHPEAAAWLKQNADLLKMQLHPKEVAEAATAMSRKLEEDHQSLKKKYPRIDWLDPKIVSPRGNYWISPDGEMGRVDNHPQAVERITKVLAEEAIYAGEDPYEEMFKMGWTRGAWDSTEKNLRLDNSDGQLKPSVRAAIRNWGIENNTSVSMRGRHIYDPHNQDSVAMSRKSRSPEEDVAAKLTAIVGGIGQDPEKLALVKHVYGQIISMPKEQWPQALTEFHAQWKDKVFADAAKEIQAKGPTKDQLSKATGIPASAFELGEALSPENIAKSFGVADRQAAYRGALYILNRPVEAIKETGGITPDVLPEGGPAVSKAVRPRYNVGDYKEFWGDFHERHPHLPEWMAREVWNEAVDDVLTNASGNRIKELLRPARLEKRFLGEGLLRTMPDINPDPILDDIAKAPDPKDSIKFRKFLAARDLTPEQGLEALKQLRDQATAEMAGAKAMLEGTEAKTVKTRAGQEVLPAGREGTGEGERRDLFGEWRKGRALNLKRRMSAQAEMSKWLKKAAAAPERDPMRRTIGLEDIWWDRRGDRGSYASYAPNQSENASFLKSALAPKKMAKGGDKSNTDSRKSRGVAVLVDRTTGDYHAVSYYVRDGLPRIYDPSGPPGSKEKSFLDMSQILSKYRVVASMTVKDPLYHFHQKWLSEKGGKSGEQKYMEEIGAVARIKEDASTEQWMEYVKGKEAEKQEELEAQHEQRFGEIKPEDEEEEAKGESGEAASKSPLSDLSQEMIRERSERETSAWRESEEVETPSRKPGKWDEAALNTWMKGPGKGVLGLYATDLSHLAQTPLHSHEAEAIYEVFKELGVKHPLDFESLIRKAEYLLGLEHGQAGIGTAVKLRRQPSMKLSGRDISALYGFDKIAAKVYGRMLRSPYEQAKLKGLPEIPEDTEYRDMNEGQKQHYIALEDLKYRALLRTFSKIYEIANEAKNAPGLEGKPGEELATPADTAAFGARAMAEYGDTARRGVEQAALSALRAPEESGARSLLGKERGPIPSGPMPPPEGMPRPKPQAMLPPGAAKYQPAPPPRGAFPLPGVPTTPSEIGGPKFTGHPPATIPERATPVGMGAEKGFIPSGPTRHELLTRKQSANRNPLREPGTEQLIMRKIAEQSRGGPPEDPAAMTRKGYGPARRYQDEMSEQGRALPRPDKDDPIIPKAELISQGRELVTSKKINTEKEMRRFEVAEQNKKGSGYLSLDSQKAFRYWGYHLQEMADAAIEEHGVKGAKDAIELSSQWQRRLEKASGETFARSGHLLQGWNQIGPDDMHSTTFVRRFLKKSKAKERGVDEDAVDLDAEDEENVRRIVRGVRQAESTRSDLEMGFAEGLSAEAETPLDEGNKKLVSRFDKYRKQTSASAASVLKKGKPTSSAMAMKGKDGELPPLDRETEDALGNVGMDVMADLSKANDLTDARWLEEMKKVLSSDDVQRPDLEPYLPHIRAVSEEIRDTAINNIVGMGDPTVDARKIFTRKKPPIEESIKAVHRALEADPSGKKISPAEAYHVWNYLKQRFFDRGILDFREIRTKASAELGIPDDKVMGVEGTAYPQLRLFRAMSTNRTMRQLSADLIKSMRDEARIKSQAMNWLKNQEYPQWLRTARMFPRLFFWDKIMGHGFVPMDTHASTMMFNPFAWSVYFGRPQWAAKMLGKKPVTGAWEQMYRMNGLLTKKGQATAEAYHDLMMNDMVNHENFEKWKSVDLQCDPFKHTDDYQIEGLRKLFGDRMRWLTEGRGFDALKTLRYAMAEKWLKSLPEHLQTKRSMELIADSVNHMTGIVKTNFHEAFNWGMFAPKLFASRFAWLIKDTIKAANYVAHWKTASLEERAWAIKELKQKAMIGVMYYGALLANQAFLSMTGSDQKINKSDPTKSDFLQFKVAGFKVGVASPFIGIYQILAKIFHDEFGNRTKFEKLTPRQRQLFVDLTEYGRGKMSPLASFTTDMISAQDFRKRPIGFLPHSEPLSRKQKLQGKTPYGPGEYALETFSPIPVEEAIKSTFESMGMDKSEAEKFIRTLVIAGGMGMTGARVSEDKQ